MAGEIKAGDLIDAGVKDRHISSSANIQASKMAQRTLQVFPQKLSDFRTWDALATNLPGTPASDDLGLVTGTFGTNPPKVQTGDLKTAGATTRYARMQVKLPDNYDDGESITIRCVAGMVTTVADTTATIDLEVYSIDPDDGSLSADICSTAVQSINSLGEAAKDFTIDPTGLVAGDTLDIRVAIAVNDGATGTAVIGSLVHFHLLCDVRP